MTITHRASVGIASGTGTGTLTFTLPTGHAADDILCAWVGAKPYTSTVTSGDIISSYTDRGSITSGVLGSAVGTGSMYAFASTKTHTGTESAPTGQLTAFGNPRINGMSAYYKTNAGAWDIASATGADTDPALTSLSVVSDVIALAPGDMLLVLVVGPDDTAIPLTPSVSATGITFDTPVERLPTNGTTAGNDGSMTMWEIPVTTGTGTVAVTFASTLANSSESSAACVFIRLREPPPPFVGPTVEASATSTGAAGSVSITQAQIAGVVADDVLAVLVSAVDPFNTDAYINTPAGWELITQQGGGVGGYYSDLRMYVRPWVSGDGTYTFTDGSGTAPYMTAECLVIRGANVADIVGFPGTATGTGTTVTGASVTASENSLLLVGALQYGTATAYSSVGTMTSRATTSEANGPSRTVIASENIISTGATGTRTLTAGAAGSGWATISVVVNNPASSDVHIIASAGNACVTSQAVWSVTLPTWTLEANDWIVVFGHSSAGSSVPTAEPDNNGEGYSFVGRIRNNSGNTLGVYVKKAVAGDIASTVSITYGTAQIQAMSAIVVRNSSGLGAYVWNPTANATDPSTVTATLSDFTPNVATGSMIAGVISVRRTGTASTASTPGNYTEVRTDLTTNGTSTNLTLKVVRDTDGLYSSPTGIADSTLGSTCFDVTFHFEMLKTVPPVGNVIDYWGAAA